MGFHRDLRGLALHAPTNEKVENNSGSSIPKLRVVSLDGHGTLYPQIVLADPNVRTNFGITTEEILDSSTGVVAAVGFMLNVDTSPWAPNTVLYSDAAGNLSTTALGNPVAIVNKQDASCGVLYVVTIGDAFSGAANPWMLDGNAGTDADVNFIGTQDNVGLTLRTNNLQRMRVDENGRFSLGQETTPKGFIHTKQHASFPGSGNIKETAAIEISDVAFNNLYNFVVPNFSMVMATFRIAAVQANNDEKAAFTRTATWFRQGANAQTIGPVQSDYTNKSDNAFDVNFSTTGDTIFLEVKNANALATRWMVTVEIDITLNDA